MRRDTRTFIWVSLLVAVILAAILSPFASSWPDGLEKVAQDHGFLKKGEAWALWKSAPIPGYVLPGLGESPLATGAAGLVGVLVVFGVSYGLVRLIKPIKKHKAQKLRLQKSK